MFLIAIFLSVLSVLSVDGATLRGNGATTQSLGSSMEGFFSRLLGEYGKNSYFRTYRKKFGEDLQRCSWMERDGIAPETGESCPPRGSMTSYTCFRGEEVTCTATDPILAKSPTHPTIKCVCEVEEIELTCEPWDPCSPHETVPPPPPPPELDPVPLPPIENPPELEPVPLEPIPLPPPELQPIEPLGDIPGTLDDPPVLEPLPPIGDAPQTFDLPPLESPPELQPIAPLGGTPGTLDPPELGDLPPPGDAPQTLDLPPIQLDEQALDPIIHVDGTDLDSGLELANSGLQIAAPPQPWIEPNEKSTWPEVVGESCDPDALQTIQAAPNVNEVFCIPSGAFVASTWKQDRVRIRYDADPNSPNFGKVTQPPNIG